MTDRPYLQQPAQPPDPMRRVRYSYGMVMGVDEFQEEQAYHLAQARMHTLALHGYGTLSGLKVRADGDQIIVSHGTALDPLGRLIQVYPAQSANLTEWLSEEKNRNGLQPRYPEPGYSLYVVLHYAESATDYTPLTGSARTRDESAAPSRVTESFRLQFATAPPTDPAEAATEGLADLLARLRPSSTDSITEEEIAEIVRGLKRYELLPPDRHLPVRPEMAQAIIETALRVWVTEVRPLPVPQLLTDEQEQPPVLLARVDFTLGAGSEITSLRLCEQGRPFVLPVRLLEERLARQLFGGGGLAPSPWPHPVPAPPPRAAIQPPGYRVVAAGEVSPDGSTRGFNLQVRYDRNGWYRVQFAGYRPDGVYVVKGTPVVRQGDRSPTFEVLRSSADTAILVRVGEGPAGFMIEISQVD